MDSTPVIVVPIYKSHVSENEQWSLRQCFKVLGNHPIVFIKPEGLDISPYIPYTFNKSFEEESFDPGFFSDIRGYNRLMLSQEFYGRFLKYSFMLIYQLDAFVFSDDLKYWCSQGFDYVGAPWIERHKFTRKIRSYLHYKLNRKQNGSISPTWLQFYNRVGNGGFSLRNIKKFHEICGSHKQMIDFYNERNHNHFFNEDVFWSIEVNRLGKRLNIPRCQKALHFAIEQKPDLALSRLNGALPFGMHAWHQYPEVWQKWMEPHV